MSRRKDRQFVLVVAILVLGLSLVPIGGQAFAAGMEVAPGVTKEVIADYGAPGIPGVEKVQLIRVIIQPGAKLENLTIKTTNYCEAVQGTGTAVWADGTTLIFGKGSRWTEPKGLTYKVLRNDGDVPFVDVFISIFHAK